MNASKSHVLSKVQKATTPIEINPSYDFDPSCRWRVKDDEVVFEVQLPGFKIGDLKVYHDGGVLKVFGDRKKMDRFYKEILVPDDCIKDGNKIEAIFSCGILHLTIPKKIHAKPKSTAANAGIFSTKTALIIGASASVVGAIEAYIAFKYRGCFLSC